MRAADAVGSFFAIARTRETMEVIFEQFPIDGTLPAEAIQAALVKGEVTKVSLSTRSVTFLAGS